MESNYKLKEIDTEIVGAIISMALLKLNILILKIF